jgi:hypothetical protein
MNTHILPILGIALIAIAACGDSHEPMQANEVPAMHPPAEARAPAPTTNTVITTENLARIAAAIYLSPERKDAILAEAAMTEDAFMALVEELSQDAEAAFRYAQAFEAELTRL